MTDTQPISEERRREIFLALVEAQDKSMSVAESRQSVVAAIQHFRTASQADRARRIE